MENVSVFTLVLKLKLNYFMLMGNYFAADNVIRSAFKVNSTTVKDDVEIDYNKRVKIKGKRIKSTWFVYQNEHRKHILLKCENLPNEGVKKWLWVKIIYTLHVHWMSRRFPE